MSAEQRLECLKLAVQMSPVDRSYETVAKIAQQLYDFCNAPQVGETQPGTADKPGRKQLRLHKPSPAPDLV